MTKETDPAKSYRLADSIDYAVQSIVSKTIIKKPGGNVTLFAFDKDEGLAQHSSPHEALVQILEGKAEIMIDENSYTLHAGEAIILPSNIPHALNANEKFKMMLTMIKS